jgi:hypothetical protein
MFKVVRFLKPLAIAVALASPMLLDSESFHCLLIFKVVRCLRLLAIAIAPYYPNWLSHESLNC